jgi:hypothetical protein
MMLIIAMMQPVHAPARKIAAMADCLSAGFWHRAGRAYAGGRNDQALGKAADTSTHSG